MTNTTTLPRLAIMCFILAMRRRLWGKRISNPEPPSQVELGSPAEITSENSAERKREDRSSGLPAEGTVLTKESVEFLKFLGSGGGGEVYKVRIANKIYALKMVSQMRLQKPKVV